MNTVGDMIISWFKTHAHKIYISNSTMTLNNLQMFRWNKQTLDLEIQAKVWPTPPYWQWLTRDMYTARYKRPYQIDIPTALLDRICGKMHAGTIEYAALPCKWAHVNTLRLMVARKFYKESEKVILWDEPVSLSDVYAIRFDTAHQAHQAWMSLEGWMSLEEVYEDRRLCLRAAMTEEQLGWVYDKLQGEDGIVVLCPMKIGV